jgi:hypothetical protein
LQCAGVKLAIAGFGSYCKEGPDCTIRESEENAMKSGLFAPLTENEEVTLRRVA